MIKKEAGRITLIFNILSAAAIALMVAADRITKIIAEGALKDKAPFEFIPGFFLFKYEPNTGISFGMFKNMNMRVILSVLTGAVILLLLWYLYVKKPQSPLLKISLVFIIAGGLGNLIDRVFLGYVIDFLLFEFDWFPYVFNVADCFVTAGGVLFFIFLLKDFVREGRLSKKGEKPQ